MVLAIQSARVSQLGAGACSAHARPICSFRRPVGIRSVLPIKSMLQKKDVPSKATRGIPPASAGECTERQPHNPVLKALDHVKQHGMQICIAGALSAALVLSTPTMAWAARSGGRVGGSSFGRSFSSSSRTSAPSRSYSAPPVVGGTTILPSVIVPVGGFYPSFGGGYGFGGGFSVVPVLVLAIVALALVLPSLMPGDGEDDAASGDVTVMKVQVGLLAQARELKERLDRLGGLADTSTPQGLAYILQETVLALMRNPSYCVYASAATSLTSNEQSAERKFNQFSLAERSKFEQETLVNVGGGRVARSQYRSRGAGSVDELIVVTVLVAAAGDVKLPKIDSLQSLKGALTVLGGLAMEQVVAVEVLWTPQAEGDFFTRDEIISDYPDLINL